MLGIVREAPRDIEAEHRDLLDLLELWPQVIRDTSQHLTITAKANTVPIAQTRLEDFSIDHQRNHRFSGHAIVAVSTHFAGE